MKYNVLLVNCSLVELGRKFPTLKSFNNPDVWKLEELKPNRFSWVGQLNRDTDSIWRKSIYIKGNCNLHLHRRKKLINYFHYKFSKYLSIFYLLFIHTNEQLGDMKVIIYITIQSLKIPYSSQYYFCYLATLPISLQMSLNFCFPLE